MPHVYLTENVIRDALKAHAITVREASELTRMLKSCEERKRKETEARMAS